MEWKAVNRMKIATSVLAALLLVGSLLTGVAVWLLRVTIEVNARNITLTGVALWQMVRQAMPDLHEAFVEIRQALGSLQAEPVIEHLR